MKRPLNKPPYVSTAEVSAALGVSVTTVKRWVDSDILPAYRTAGGHRKLLMEDVRRAIRDGHLPQADMLAAVKPDSLVEAFRTAVETADLTAIRGVIRKAARDRLPVETLADDVLAPGLAHLGRLWVAEKIDVIHEHRVSQACIAALIELDSQIESAAKSRPVAVGGAPEGDFSVMPSLLAKMALADRGWDAVNLGPHTPFEAFHAALDEFSPKLVWLTVSHVVEPELFLKGYQKFHHEASKRGTAIAIGGLGLKDLREKMLYTTFGDGLTHLVEFAKSLHQSPQRPKRGRPVKP